MFFGFLFSLINLPDVSAKSFRIQAKNMPTEEASSVTRNPLRAKPEHLASLALGQKKEGFDPQIVSVPLVATSQETSVNAVQVKIFFNPSELIPLVSEIENSSFSLFPAEDIDLQNGELTVYALQPFPGILGQAEVLDVKFIKLDPEEESLIEISIEDSRVYANDGFATDILDKSLYDISTKV